MQNQAPENSLASRERLINRKATDPLNENDEEKKAHLQKRPSFQPDNTFSDVVNG